MRANLRYLVKSLKVSPRLTFVDARGIAHVVDKREMQNGTAFVNLMCDRLRYRGIAGNPLRRDMPVSCMACIAEEVKA